MERWRAEREFRTQVAERVWFGQLADPATVVARLFWRPIVQSVETQAENDARSEHRDGVSQYSPFDTVRFVLERADFRDWVDACEWLTGEPGFELTSALVDVYSDAFWAMKTDLGG